MKKRSTNVGDNVYPTVEGRDSEEWMVVDCGTLTVSGVLFLHSVLTFFIILVFCFTRKHFSHRISLHLLLLQLYGK